MAPKTNAKAAAANARKADAAEGKKKQEAAKKEAENAEEWSKGAKGKGKGEDKAAAAAAAKARKDEAARLLAEEEASLKGPAKAAPKAGAKKSAPAKVSAASKIPSFGDGTADEANSFSASGIDDALDMLSLVTERTDKAFVGSKASQIEQHPERRYKAAFEAYKESELPEMKKDFPGLRLQQYNEKLFQNFKKSPLNPFNQVSISYDATKEDKVAALQAQKEEIAKRLRDN